MFLVRRWWGCIWPWSLGAAVPQPPAPPASPPPPARPPWAGPTLFLGPLLTFGQRLGYRTDRGKRDSGMNAATPRPELPPVAGPRPRPRNGGPGYPVPPRDGWRPGKPGDVRRNPIHRADV